MAAQVELIFSTCLITLVSVLFIAFGLFLGKGLLVTRAT